MSASSRSANESRRARVAASRVIAGSNDSRASSSANGLASWVVRTLVSARRRSGVLIGEPQPLQEHSGGDGGCTTTSMPQPSFSHRRSFVVSPRAGLSLRRASRTRLSPCSRPVIPRPIDAKRIWASLGDPKLAAKTLNSAFADVPEPMRSVLTQRADKVTSKLREEIIETVVPGRFVKGAVEVGHQRKPVQPNPYVAKVLHHLRNTHHGYELQEQAQRDILDTHSGHISAAFPELVVLYLVAARVLELERNHGVHKAHTASPTAPDAPCQPASAEGSKMAVATKPPTSCSRSFPDATNAPA